MPSACGQTAVPSVHSATSSRARTLSTYLGFRNNSLLCIGSSSSSSSSSSSCSSSSSSNSCILVIRTVCDVCVAVSR